MGCTVVRLILLIFHEKLLPWQPYCSGLVYYRHRGQTQLEFTHPLLVRYTPQFSQPHNKLFLHHCILFHFHHTLYLCIVWRLRFVCLLLFKQVKQRHPTLAYEENTSKVVFCLCKFRRFYVKKYKFLNRPHYLRSSVVS